MSRNKIITIFASLLALISTHPAAALQMPESANDLIGLYTISAASYIVTDAKTGEMLFGQNIDAPRIPASLTKLVTALVVLDSKTKLTKVVSMTNADQTAGECKNGGSCIKAVSGIKFTVNGLFHAALLPSANNAANALARSTGLTQDQFVARMNAKVKALGATNTFFVEPTGINPGNVTTASDYSKIVAAAFSNSYLKEIAQLNTFRLISTNNSKYNQTIKNSDKLVGSADNRIQVLGAKTGYLDESLYNFASLLKYNGGTELSVVVLGEPHLYTAFDETQLLARLGQEARELLKNNIITLVNQ